MNAFTLDDIRTVLTAAAIDQSTADLDSDIGDRTFTEFGCDSLALVEIRTVIERRTGVPVPADVLHEQAVPADIVAYVNDALRTPPHEVTV